MFSCNPFTLRLLVVDDHELTRFSLKLAFSYQENIEVVGLASNGQEAIEMVKSCHPNVIILDLQMPVMDGWTASSQIKAISPKTQILAYSSLGETHLQQTKTMPSFDDVCKKDVPITDLITLVRNLGQKFIPT